MREVWRRLDRLDALRRNVILGRRRDMRCFEVVQSVGSRSSSSPRTRVRWRLEHSGTQRLERPMTIGAPAAGRLGRLALL